jgi:hypothetical protein
MNSTVLASHPFENSPFLVMLWTFDSVSESGSLSFFPSCTLIGVWVVNRCGRCGTLFAG